MKRNLLILLASAGISVAGLTEASAQNENPTLSPDTLRGIALWGNKSHQNNQDSGSNKENETFLSGAEGINSKNLTLPAQENSPAGNRNPEEGTHAGGSPSANRGQDIPAAATGMEPGWNPGTPESGPQTPTTNASIPAQQASTKNESEVSYVPRVDGAVKAKLEVSLNDGEYRFNVRNTRFGVSGNVSRNMFYRIQVDFNNEGKLSILDSYAGYRTGGLDIRLGQQQYHFSTDLDRGPTARRATTAANCPETKSRIMSKRSVRAISASWVPIHSRNRFRSNSFWACSTDRESTIPRGTTRST